MSLKIIKGSFVSAPTLGELDIHENAYMALNDGVIEGVFDVLPEEYAGCPTDDYGDCLILQSFADMHLHGPQFPMLGLGMDLPLLEWLNTYTFEEEARFSDEHYAREVYKKLAHELISRGTTRVCMFSSIHVGATLILMEELEKAGVTGYVGKVNMDRNGGAKLQEDVSGSIRDTIKWLEACGSFKYIKPIITPRFTPSCSDGLMEELGKIANARGLYVQSHLSENESEIDWVKALRPDCEAYWQTYDKHGMWKSHTIMAHCVHCTDGELKALKDSDILVAHCPDSNVNICSGVAPIRRMLDAGIWVALGSDIAGGAQLSMNDVITGAIRTSKTKRMESGYTEDFLTVAEGYYLGTTAGHRYFGAGAGFCPGDALHAVVIDDSDFSALRSVSIRERFERSLYLAKKEHIRAVYSEGRLISP